MAYVSFDVSAVISFLLLPTREAHSFLQSFDVLSCFVSSRSTLFTATSSPTKQQQIKTGNHKERQSKIISNHMGENERSKTEAIQWRSVLT